ncbi:LPXTG cell wall anchor domain-containing protein [Mycolicibacterium boenickei]
MEETAVIGLAIGDTPNLNREVNATLPGTIATPAGTVEVGITTRAELSASPDDATITPSLAKNASTVDEIELLWTWHVTPKRPTDELMLTAHIEVPLDGGGSFNTDIPLRIPVKRSIGYTAGQIFDSWATWSAIAVSVAGGAGWFFRRRRRAQPTASAQEVPERTRHGMRSDQTSRSQEALAPPEAG